MKKEEDRITAEGAVDRYADMIYRLALVQVRNPSDADDIFQEVFVRLVSHIHKMKTWEHVKAWLLRVTINCSRKHFSQFWHRNVSTIEDKKMISVQEEGFNAVENYPISEAIGLLPAKYKAVIHLFYYEELSIREIAEMTNQKETTVKSQLSRGRERLKKALEGDMLI